MAITNGDQYIAAAKQMLRWVRTTTRTTVATGWFSLLDVAGAPTGGAGSLTLTETTSGAVPVDTDAPYPTISGFAAGATGYLAGLNFSSSVASRIHLYDRLYHAGSFALSSLGSQTLTAQPSYAVRLPGGSYQGLDLFLEVATAVPASAATVEIIYANQAGVSGRTTGPSQSLASLTLGRLIPMPLQAGDTGVQTIEEIIVGGVPAATGAVNVVVARPLVTSMRVPVAGAGDILGLDRTGMPEVTDQAALWPIVSADSTSSGLPEMLIEVASR